MRVIAGRFGGRRLRVPSSGVRPTSDRVREALFAVLGDLAGARVLDLFAGSGALGIEALSRGASEAVFAERAAAAVAAVRANLEALGAEGSGRVVRGDAVAVVRRLARAGACFDLVFLDPPWTDPAEPARTLRALASSGILASGATVVVESGRGRAVVPVAGLALVD